MSKLQNRSVVQKAIKKAGGIVALGRALGITHNAIYSWKRIPSERVREVEAITGIPRHELRPDLYGEETAA